MIKKLPKIILIITLIFALILGIVGLTRLKITNTICVSQYGPCSNSIVSDIDKVKGKGIFSAFSDVRKILSKNKSVSQYSVRFNLPSYIKVLVVEKKGEVMLTRQGSSNGFVVDKDGYVLYSTDKSSLPSIIYFGGKDLSMTVGSQVQDNFKFAEDIERVLFSHFDVRTLNLYDDRIEFKLKNGHKVIFPVAGEADVLLGSLELILSRLNNTSQEFRIVEIDLRYKNPVIR